MDELSRRDLFAAMVMQGMLAAAPERLQLPEDTAAWAVKHANELIAALDGENRDTDAADRPTPSDPP